MNIKVLVALLVFFSMTGSAFAQEKAKTEASEKQVVKTIFNYKSELGLTDKQVQDLKAILDGFQQFLADKKQELGLINSELATMIRDKADMRAIRGKLEQIARIQVDVSYTDIETARKTENVLIPSQLKKWKAMQEEFRSKSSPK